MSILLVLFAHTAGTQHFPSFVFLRRNLGNFGVRIFFIISGFLITSLLLKELDKTAQISLKQFYVRRFFRIFPAAYFYLGVMTLLTVLGWVSLEAKDLLHGFTYTTNYERVRPWLMIHLWSLSVEEQFYMIWPATLVLAGRRKALWIAATMLVIAPALRALIPIFQPDWAWMGGTAFQTNADALATGCLLAGWRDRIYAMPGYKALLHSRWVMVFPLAALIFTLMVSAEGRLFAFAGQTFLNLCVVVLLDRVLRVPDDAVGRLLNWKPLMTIGVLSYSLYLWQQPFLNRLGNQTIHAFPLNLALAMTAACISYLLVERPCLEMRKRFQQ